MSGIWRLATKEDEPAIAAILLEQEEHIGYSLDFPDLFEKPVLRCEVCELDGRIIGAMVFEANVECYVISTDRRFTDGIKAQYPRWYSLFKGLGFRVGRAFVPKRFAKAMSRYLRGIARNLDDQLSHLLFDLRD